MLHLTTGDISLLLLASLFIGYGIYKVYSMVTAAINSIKNEYASLKYKMDNTERTIQQLSNEASTMIRLNQLQTSFNLGTDIGRALQPIVAMFRRSQESTVNPTRPIVDFVADSNPIVNSGPPSPIILTPQPRPRTRRCLHHTAPELLNTRVPQQPPEIVQRQNVPIDDHE